MYGNLYRIYHDYGWFTLILEIQGRNIWKLLFKLLSIDLCSWIRYSNQFAALKRSQYMSSRCFRGYLEFVFHCFRQPVRVSVFQVLSLYLIGMFEIKCSIGQLCSLTSLTTTLAETTFCVKSSEQDGYIESKKSKTTSSSSSSSAFNVRGPHITQAWDVRHPRWHGSDGCPQQHSVVSCTNSTIFNGSRYTRLCHGS